MRLKGGELKAEHSNGETADGESSKFGKVDRFISKKETSDGLK